MTKLNASWPYQITSDCEIPSRRCSIEFLLLSNNLFLTGREQSNNGKEQTASELESVATYEGHERAWCFQKQIILNASCDWNHTYIAL